jgi:hypothetical protein
MHHLARDELTISQQCHIHADNTQQLEADVGKKSRVSDASLTIPVIDGIIVRMSRVLGDI